MTRRSWPIGLLLACSSGPSYDPHPALPPWMPDASVFVSGHDLEDQYDCRTQICRHNENVDMIAWGNAIWLVHRTARSQVLGPNSSLHVYRSTDGGKSFADVATLQAPADRDLRDPSFYVVGSQLFIKALTRLPVNSTRDSNVDTLTVETHSVDGVAWSPLRNMAPDGWSFWRVKQNAGVYYSAAYQDGDLSVALFSSTDGSSWTMGPPIYGVSADTPLETELTFMPSGRMLALVRMDGDDAHYLGTIAPLRTKVCWSTPPYTASFDCSAELTGVRLDGPLSFFWNNRLFVLARKHLLDDSGRKRTALYEITGNLEGGPIDYKEWGEIPSAGDTSYAGYAMLDPNRALVAWYSGDLDLDRPWVVAMFDLTDIWRGTIDFTKLK